MLVRSLIVAVTLAAAACGGGGGGASGPRTTTSAAPTTTARPDPAAVGANELGSVPVVMYHRIVDVVKGEYDRTEQELRAELAQLHAAGFRPVTAREYVTGEMPIEAGMSPVVLTFDDSSRDQFALTGTGEVEPQSAVGILLDFAASHPGFRPVATMFVNAGPFGVADGAPLLRKLDELGFELGNHTAGHVNLAKLDPAAAQREIVLGQEVITSSVPGASVDTMALPLGIRPKDRSILTSGSSGGRSYSLKGVFLVGAGPAPSPFAASFDPAGIPRMRSSTWDGGEPNYGTGYWLDWFSKHPDRRFVSDGDPTRISFPADRAPQLAPAFTERANGY